MLIHQYDKQIAQYVTVDLQIKFDTVNRKGTLLSAIKFNYV